MLVKNPWNIVRTKLKEEGAYNRMYDPNLTGLITKVDPSVANKVVAEAFTVSFSSGQGAVTLSQTPVDISHVWVLSKNPTYVILPSSLNGNTLTLVPYTHLHNHSWLNSMTLQGESAITDFYYYTITDGGGNTLQDSSGNAIQILAKNNAPAQNGLTSADGGLSVTTASISVDVIVFYVPQT